MGGGGGVIRRDQCIKYGKDRGRSDFKLLAVRYDMLHAVNLLFKINQHCMLLTCSIPRV